VAGVGGKIVGIRARRGGGRRLMLALLGHAHDFISFASLAAVLWMGLRHLLVRNGYTPRRARSPACPSVSLSLFPHQRRQ
jgi:hypothetical protein